MSGNYPLALRTKSLASPCRPLHLETHATIALFTVSVSGRRNSESDQVSHKMRKNRQQAEHCTRLKWQPQLRQPKLTSKANSCILC